MMMLFKKNRAVYFNNLGVKSKDKIIADFLVAWGGSHLTDLHELKKRGQNLQKQNFNEILANNDKKRTCMYRKQYKKECSWWRCSMWPSPNSWTFLHLLRTVQTMEHIPRHSLTRQPRTWCSLVRTVSKHAANMLRICSKAELYCRRTNQKLSVFRMNTKAFLAAECWFGLAAAAVCATSIFSQTLEHHVCGCRNGCATEHVR